MPGMDGETRTLIRAISRTPAVASQARSDEVARAEIQNSRHSDGADVMVSVAPAQRERAPSRVGSPWLTLAYRCVGTLSTLGLTLLLLGATMVWSTREAMKKSSPRLENIQAVLRHDELSRSVFVSVETTLTPAQLSHLARRDPVFGETQPAILTTAMTTEMTATDEPACQLNTDVFFCRRAVHGWYYRDQTCRSTEHDDYAVCPKFVGQLATERECRSRCFLFQKKNCAGFQTTLRPCSSKDLSRTWYFLNATSGYCVEWDYPEGACPNVTAGSGYNTKTDCERECTTARVGHKPQCEWPSELVACSADLMKHAYFYSELLGSTGDCYRADMSTLTGHRCVDPAALFPTEVECVSKCFRQPS
ncbi:uncharacterized protein [Dermacentor albipictus]|uniref:uncharacterized protein n=1 Tax=Dermacentor albipictus TaxID=60249 RepID=UPI0031FD8319